MKKSITEIEIYISFFLPTKVESFSQFKKSILLLAHWYQLTPGLLYSVEAAGTFTLQYKTAIIS